VVKWTFLTNHGRVMLFIAAHPDARLRDIASALGVTERTAYGVVAELHAAGYLFKERVGGRNRYQVQGHLPLPDSRHFPSDDAHNRERTVGGPASTLAELPMPPLTRARDAGAR
jgi:hypothetical protein